MATHSSTPAWKIPWTEGPGGLLHPYLTKLNYFLFIVHLAVVFSYQVSISLSFSSFYAPKFSMVISYIWFEIIFKYLVLSFT